MRLTKCLMAARVMTVVAFVCFWGGCHAALCNPGHASSLPSKRIVHVPEGKSILPNGKFAPGEWDDANTIEVRDGPILHFKHDRSYIYIGIEFTAAMHTGVDLYVAESSERRKRLHISAALGEMDFVAGSWSDWKWGENALWTANSIGLIIEDGKQEVVPLEGFEFQIDKALFPAKTWHIWIHMKRPELQYPWGAGTEDTENWLEVVF